MSACINMMNTYELQLLCVENLRAFYLLQILLLDYYLCTSYSIILDPYYCVCSIHQIATKTIRH